VTIPETEAMRRGRVLATRGDLAESFLAPT
jgi:hypothetical protein